MADQCCKYSMPPESKKIQGKKAVLFILSPFLALLYSLRSLERRSSRLVIFGFCVCFGMAFTVANVRTEGSIDGITYREDFEKMCDCSFEDLASFYTIEGGVYYGATDLYYNAVSFLVSRVTDNYHVLFMVFAIVFAFFQIKSLHILTKSKNFHFSVAVLILVGLFTWYSIYNINGVRFWTAYWVAIYSSLRIFYEGKLKYYFLALLTPLFHISFIIFCFFLLISHVSIRCGKIWVYAFFISFAASLFIVQIARDVATFLPFVIAKKMAFYTDETHITEVSTGTGFFWVSRLFSLISWVYINFMTFMLLKERHRLPSARCSNLMQLMLVVMTFANLTMPIPSIGVRFITLSYPLIALLWLDIYNDVKYKWVVYVLPFAWAMNIYYLLKDYLSVIDWTFFVTGPFVMIPRFLVQLGV